MRDLNDKVCIKSCNIINTTTCQITRSINQNFTSEIAEGVRDEDGCYDPFIGLPFPSSFEHYINFYYSMSVFMIILSITGVICNMISNRRVDEKLCLNFSYINSVIKTSDR